MISATIIADSINQFGVRLTTMVLEYPRFIHAEFMTHRVFSRNASSSRAIPVKTILDNIRSNMAQPIHWGSNIPGMQAGDELTGNSLTHVKALWENTSVKVCDISEQMCDEGLHKQVANRITEPFQHIKVVVTATEWDNFFGLRNHDAAQPEIHELAKHMQVCMETSTPKKLKPDQYHLPFVSDQEANGFSNKSDAIKCSVARCARVSYLNHDKTNPDIPKDIALYDMLLSAGHMSPFEHIANPMYPFSPEDFWEWGITHMDRDNIPWSGNFRGWIQHRQKLIS